MNTSIPEHRMDTAVELFEAHLATLESGVSLDPFTMSHDLSVILGIAFHDPTTDTEFVAALNEIERRFRVKHPDAKVASGVWGQR